MIRLIVFSGLFFIFSLFFLLGFALRLGVSEKNNKEMFTVALCFAGSATAVFFVLWFLSHPN